jgi:integrase
MTKGLSDLGPAGGGRNERRWRLRYRGQSRNVTGTEAHARREYARLVAAVEERRITAARREHTVGTALDTWIERHQSLGARQRAEMPLHRRRLEPLLRVPLRSLERADVERLVRGMQAAGLAPATIRRTIVSVLGPALHEAERDGLLLRNPVPACRLPSVERVERDVDPAEVAKVVAAAWERSPSLGALGELAAATGMRCGELCALRWVDVGPRVRVRASLGRDLAAKSTKTGRARTVEWSAEALAAAERWRLHSVTTAMAAGVAWNGDGWLLSEDPTGVVPMSPHVASVRWGRHARACGSTLRLHDLRHAAASRWLWENRDIAWVSRQLGHASSVVTLGVYAHVIEQRG